MKEISIPVHIIAFFAALPSISPKSYQMILIKKLVEEGYGEDLKKAQQERIEILKNKAIKAVGEAPY